MSTVKTNPSYRWVIMIINMLICALAYAGLTVWSTASAALTETFQITATVASLGSSMFMLGYAVGCLAENYIANKKGYRLAGITGLCLMVIGCLGIPAAPGYGVVLLCRFCQGWGILWLIGVNSTVAWFPARQRGLAASMAGAGNAIGIGCGGLLASGLITVTGSWQGAFRGFGLILLIAAVIWGVLMREPPRDLYPEEQADMVGPEEKKINPYKTAAAWLCAVCLFLFVWQYIGFSTVASGYAVGMGYSQMQAGAIVLIFGLVGIVTPVAGGCVSDFLAQKMPAVKARSYVQAIIAFGLGAIATFFYPLFIRDSFALTVVGAILVGAFTPVVNTTIGALPMDLLENRKAANDMFALTCLIGFGAGGFIAPFIANYTAEHFGWTAMMSVLAMGPVAGAMISFILPKFKRNR